MLIHSPQPWNDFRGGDYADGNRQAWRALEDAHKDGRIRAIGVSNYWWSVCIRTLSNSLILTGPSSPRMSWTAGRGG
ncbi:aldo/keto reductase [Actinoplanes sp. CA-054009]